MTGEAIVEAVAPQASKLSIVVQGRLNAADAVQCTRRCRDWRNAFPEAEIILSVSSSDVLAVGMTGRERLPTAAGSGGRSTANAFAELADTVDKFALADPAEPLVPLKFGGARNNVNLQIAAAQAGLAAASRPLTLRVRSDLTLSGPILDHYAEGRAAAPEATILSQRVMICHLFTLNPYHAERLPFHYSDWFQLGATTDLREMWAVARYDAADASYYDTHPHARYSNRQERDFQARFAAEQFIALGFFRRKDRNLTMDFHNDLLCRHQAMRILFSEFIIADPKSYRLEFPKYHHVLDHPFSDLLCATHEDWRHFAVTRSDTDYRRYFSDKAKRLGSFPGGYS